MNLFTTYTPEETKFLLSLVTDQVIEFSEIPFFEGINKKELDNILIYKRFVKLSKKEILKDYDYLIILKGKLAVIDSNKVLKVLNKYDLFGFSKVLFNKNYTLVAAEESEVLLFNHDYHPIISERLLKYLAKGKVL